MRLGADLDVRVGIESRTALMAAAQFGRVECARALLAGGADPTLRERNRETGARGRTALEIAEFYDQPEVEALLREPEELLREAEEKSINRIFSILAILLIIIGGGYFTLKGGKRRKTKRLKY